MGVTKLGSSWLLPQLSSFSTSTRWTFKELLLYNPTQQRALSKHPPHYFCYCCSPNQDQAPTLLAVSNSCSHAEFTQVIKAPSLSNPGPMPSPLGYTVPARRFLNEVAGVPGCSIAPTDRPGLHLAPYNSSEASGEGKGTPITHKGSDSCCPGVRGLGKGVRPETNLPIPISFPGDR